MNQSKRDSAIETLANVISGFILSFGIQLAVFPLFGLSITLADNFYITSIFVGASLIRGYAFRRLFNYLGAKKEKRKLDNS